MVHLPKTRYQVLGHEPKVLFCLANCFCFLIEFGHKFIDCPLQNDCLVSFLKKSRTICKTEFPSAERKPLSVFSTGYFLLVYPMPHCFLPNSICLD